VSNAVGGRRVAHGYRYIPGFRAIIDFRQDVRMYVDHGNKSAAKMLNGADSI
jgi:hypothetical protein